MKKIALMLTVALALSGCVYSHGERVGIVTKLSNKGFICKTWEGEMTLGGFKNQTKGDNTSVVANVFEFTVSDQAVVDKIQKAMQNGDRVSLVYDEYLMHNPCNGSTDYFIVDVK